MALATSFMPGKRNENNNQYKTTQVPLYWFDTLGTYLRTNTLDDEVEYTGFNNIPASPKTLRELGYKQGECSGNPPVPLDPDFPEQRLYSHP